MTREERLAYQRGYAAGIKGKWPSHKPPYPPTKIIGELLRAIREIRDQLDAELAAISDEEWESKFGPLIDRADEAGEMVTNWLTGSEEE